MTNTPAAAPAAAPMATTARVLLGEQTASSLLRNIVYVYRHHAVIVLSCAVLPVLPFLVLLELFAETSPLMAGVGALGYFAGMLICPATLTVVISDICVGTAPKLSRAFGHILGRGRWWHLLSTGLLLGLAMVVGLFALLVGAFWVLVRSLFGATIVALEGRRNVDALRRSFELTRGQGWRLTGLTLLPILVAYLAMIPIAVLLVIGASLAGPDSTLAQHVVAIGILAASLGLILPVASITTVLLYYDQRVRRESYDAQALSEDLMR